MLITPAPERPHMRYLTSTDGKTSHWEIIDDDGTVLVSDTQPPHPRLLHRLGLAAGDPPAPKPTSSTSKAPTPAIFAAQTPPATPAAPVEEDSTLIFSTGSNTAAIDRRTDVVGNALDALPEGSPLDALSSVRTIMDRHELTLDDLRSGVRNPHTVRPQRNNALAISFFHEPYSIRTVIGADGMLLHIQCTYAEGQHGTDPQTHRRAKKSSGTHTRRNITDITQLRQILREEGFTITPGRKHDRVEHPDIPGVKTSLVKTPSDTRTVNNTVSNIRNQFGIDLRNNPQ